MLGGLGIGSTWGWLLVVAAVPTLRRFVPTGVALGLASFLLAAGVYWLAGSDGLAGFVVATIAGAMACVATRAELARIRVVRGTGGRS